MTGPVPTFHLCENGTKIRFHSLSYLEVALWTVYGLPSGFKSSFKTGLTNRSVGVTRDPLCLSALIFGYPLACSAGRLWGLAVLGFVNLGRKKLTAKSYTSNSHL
jgi:hypothetical protein